MYSVFALPREVLVGALLGEFPCREAQIRALGALVAVSVLALPVISLQCWGMGYWKRRTREGEALVASMDGFAR